MVYTNNVPVTGQSLGASRDLINGNFQILQTTIDRNHVDMNQANAGKHNFVELLQQSASPGTAGDVFAMYSAESGGALEVFLQKAGFATGMGEIQLTKGNVTNTGNDWATFLPGGILLRLGTVNYSGSSPKSVTYAHVFTSVLTLNVWCATGAQGNKGQININSSNTMGFTFSVTGGLNNLDYGYLAIGL